MEHIAAFEQMKTYTVADGLVGPIVPVIFQDSRGLLWVGSDRGGVSHFDGDTFVPSPRNTDALRGRTEAIVEDKWGHIWILSKHPSEGIGVISRYDGSEFKLIGNGHCLLIDKNGDVWVGGNNTVTRYAAINRKEVPQGLPINIPSPSIAKINVIFQSKDGTFWIGGNDAQGLLILSFTGDINAWQLGNIKRYEIPADLPQNRAIQVITQDYDGHLWFGGHSILLRYDGVEFHVIVNDTTGSARQADVSQEIDYLDNRNVTVKSDTRGRIWFSDNNHLSWWDGNKLQRLMRLGLEANQDLYLSGSFEIEDAWNKLWFSTETGAHLYNYKYFEEKSDNFPLSPLLSGQSEAYHKVYRVDQGLGSDNIQTIYESIDGKIWFGHDNGVTSYEPQPIIVNHTTPVNLGSNSVRLMFTDSTDVLWLSIPGGVAQYDAGQDKFNGTLLTNLTFQTGGLTIDINLGNQRNNRRTDIKKVFEVDGDIWFVDKPIQHKDGYTLFRIFRYRKGIFNRLSLQIQAEIDPGGELDYSNSDIHLTLETPPKIVIGGFLFQPHRDGLRQLLPIGVAKNITFNSTVSLPMPSSAITTLHTDNDNRLWCYFESGEVKRYTNIGSSVRHPQVEVLPLKSVIPVLDSTEDNDINWFYNSVSGQLMYWENPDTSSNLTELPGSASGPPLKAVKTSYLSSMPATENPDEQENNQSDQVTFLFRDGIKTYDGTELKNAGSVEIGEVRGLLTTAEGDLWLATSQGAIRYNGVEATTYTTTDGFLVDDLRDVHEDNWGNIWFATWGGGVVRYDGNSFQSITTKDGLIHNNVSSIHAFNEENLWFGTEGGVTQYRANLGALPFCRILSVEANKSYTEPFNSETGKHTFTEIDELLPAYLKEITIHFRGISPLRDNVEYKFRLIGVDNNDWTTISSDIHSSDIQDHSLSTQYGDVTQTFQSIVDGDTKGFPQVRYEGLKSGDYTFLIKAFREGWPYAQSPATLKFTIDQPIWSRWRKYFPSLLLLAAAGSLLYRLIVNQRRTAQLRLEMREKEEADMQRIRAELNEAQNIQMGLLPTEAPDTQEFDIAGLSVPATQVGGDFFDYLTVANGHTAVAVADAAGKGIRGAMNAVLTNGMLHEVARYKSDADVILSDLNLGLAPRMYGPSFIALNLAVINESEKRVDYANGGQPYPILKRGTETIEIENSDLPLGSMKNIQYESVTFDLEEDDLLIFHSDGLIEALNANHDMYGTDRLKDLISQLPNESSPDDVIQHIVEDVQKFVEDEEQYDDMTIVVVKRKPVS